MLHSCFCFVLFAGSAAAGLASSSPTPPQSWLQPPGVVVEASPEPETTFIGSPSIAIMSDGCYVASHDFFGPKARADLSGSTRVFASRDRGATWQQLAQLQEQIWSVLFVHRKALYLMGLSKEYSDIVIRRSLDGGRTWTTPVDEHTGRLFRGHYHCSPTAGAKSGGRLWRAFARYAGPEGTSSGRFLNTFVVSAPEDADLLQAQNWTRTNEIPFGADWISGDRPGWQDGNVVIAPNGRLVNVLMVDTRPSLRDRFPLEGPVAGISRYEVAAMIDIAADGRSIDFNSRSGFFQFPGSQAKFTIRFDPQTRLYWSLVNKITNPYAGYDNTDYAAVWQRNVVVLTSSPDLRHWDERYIALRWREGLPVYHFDRVGFQYIDWRFDGDDIIAVSRTSWNGSTYHNANYLTFHRLRNFRTLTLADSPPPLMAPAASADE